MPNANVPRGFSLHQIALAACLLHTLYGMDTPLHEGLVWLTGDGFSQGSTEFKTGMAGQILKFNNSGDGFIAFRAPDNGLGAQWILKQNLSSFTQHGDGPTPQPTPEPSPPTPPPAGMMQINALSANLFWWNLFGQRGGADGIAGKTIAANAPLALMGFQECEDVGRVLRDGGLQDRFGSHQFGNAIAIAWDKATFGEMPIEMGQKHVAHDRPDQNYGFRDVAWARFRHNPTGRHVWFGTHHGPLPVNTGGKDGEKVTAENICKLIADTSEPGDITILVGDFNDYAGTIQRIGELMDRIPTDYKGHNDFTPTANPLIGVDNVFVKQGLGGSSRAYSIGSGGSDHPLIKAELFFKKAQ